MPCVIYTPSLTPPEYSRPYGAGSGMQMAPHPYMDSRTLSCFAEDGALGYKKAIAAYPPPPRTFLPQHQTAYTGLPPPGITHPGGPYYQSNPSSGNYLSQSRVELPPIVDDGYHSQQQTETRKLETAAAVAEKPVGGVAQHLDYEVEDMTDFVASISQGLIYGPSMQDRVSSPFRKFVLQILSSTRLPSSTIFLGLMYLRERITFSPLPKSLQGRPDLVHLMLTVSLLLASKFLDDNTFQNKSWSEVTQIPVLELNALEKEWLEEISWNLHIDTEGTKGFAQYKTMWEGWMRSNREKAAAPVLAPINTNLRSRPSQGSFTPLTPYPLQNPHYTPPLSLSHRPVQLPPPRPTPQHETSGYYWSPTQGSPPSAPHTGPPTPESYFGWNDCYTPQSSIAPSLQPVYSRLPPIMPPSFCQHAWDSTRCPCWHCKVEQVAQAQRGYISSNYVQPVAA